MLELVELIASLLSRLCRVFATCRLQVTGMQPTTAMLPADASPNILSYLPFAGMRCNWSRCSCSAAEHDHHGERPPCRRHAIHVLCTTDTAAPIRRVPISALWSVDMTSAFPDMQTPVTVPLQAGMRTNSSFLDLNDPTLPGANATGQTPTQVRLSSASMICGLVFVDPFDPSCLHVLGCKTDAGLQDRCMHPPAAQLWLTDSIGYGNPRRPSATL